jgi:hypothetical protein
MTDLRVATITGEEATLDGATVDGFRASLRGQLICPGGPRYDETRKVWNGMIDRRPALIARCAGWPMSSRRYASPAAASCWCRSALSG